MWDTLWTNAKVATLRSGRYSALVPGAVAAQAAKIVWVGAPESDKQCPAGLEFLSPSKAAT